MNQTELERLEQYEKDLIRLETEAENALLKLEQCIGEIRRSDQVSLRSDCDRILQRLSVLM